MHECMESLFSDIRWRAAARAADPAGTGTHPHGAIVRPKTAMHNNEIQNKLTRRIERRRRKLCGALFSCSRSHRHSPLQIFARTCCAASR